MSADGRQPARLLDHPEGGSLNSIRLEHGHIVKSYGGDLARGYDKLRREYSWLRLLPADVARHFAPIAGFVDQPGRVELRLEYLDLPSAAKAILRDEIDPERAGAVVRAAMAFDATLFDRNTRQLDGAAMYAEYHGRRLDAALRSLGAMPEFAPLIEARELSVNGVSCPPYSAIAEWSARTAPGLLAPGRAGLAHGDLHYDNVLTTTTGDLRFVLVDPRGDATIPPHYDFAKMLKSTRGFYDGVHYGKSRLEVEHRDGATRVRLDRDTSWDGHYDHGLDALLSFTEQYADSERVTVADFSRAVGVAEMCHVISFSNYHAHHPTGPHVERVRSYLAIAALMAARVLGLGPDSEYPLSRSLFTR